MKMLITNNLTGLDEEVEVDAAGAPPSPSDIIPTPEERISELETLVLQLGGII